MPEARELRTVIEAAEQAASTGDYVTAELSLREAAALQETELGPFHPDLANTLNNLAVAYESVGETSPIASAQVAPASSSQPVSRKAPVRCAAKGKRAKKRSHRGTRGPARCIII